MHHQKIPLINDKFDPAIFFQIVKKHYWVALVLLVISVLAGFLYLRYTPREYNAYSIIQINETNRTTRILNIEDINKDDDISKVVELLRSKEFLKRAFLKLNLEVTYFVEGTFLASELYKRSPFVVEYEVSSPEMYDRIHYIEFKDINTADIVIYNNDIEERKTIVLNTWDEIWHGKIRCQLVDLKTITEQQENYKNNRFYFIINNPQSLVNQHIQNLNISLLNKSAQTIEISYSGLHADKATDIVNTIAEDYLVYDVETKKESAANILAFIEDRLKAIYSNLDETEKNLHAFKKENKINSEIAKGGATPFPIFTAKMGEIEDEIIQIEFELAALERINQQIVNENNLNVYELVALLVGTKSETVVASILNNLQQLLNQKEQLLNDVTPDNIKIKVIDKQIVNQRLLLQDFIGTTITRLRNTKSDYQNKVTEYEQKLFDDKNFNELEYAKLERLYSINEGFYHKLMEKKAEYLISQAGYVSQNTILEKAITPQSPVSPIKEKIYPLFILLGVFFGAGYILVRYLIYDEVTSINIIKNYTDAPILGTVPVYRADIPVSQLLVNKKPNSIFTEAFRTIRSNLQFISHGAETKIITVSSTISGEGKTFVAINLAGILAISGKKVILLDLDLRKPRIHLGFNTKNEKGISTYLIGKHNLEECIEKSELLNFDYITAGPVPPNPAELAAGKQMEKLLAELDEIYDIIIIDTPPVGIVTDALTNLQRANYPIYVMKANVSKRHFIDNINLLRAEKNMDNLSVILNGVNLHQKRYGSYGYGYGYGYGNGYYTDDEEITIGKKLTQKLQKLKK